MQFFQEKMRCVSKTVVKSRHFLRAKEDSLRSPYLFNDAVTICVSVLPTGRVTLGPLKIVLCIFAKVNLLAFGAKFGGL